MAFHYIIYQPSGIYIKESFYIIKYRNALLNICIKKELIKINIYSLLSLSKYFLVAFYVLTM